MNNITFKIPATSANLGLGFDSMGIAVDKFLTISAKPATNWSISFHQEALKKLPNDEHNLVIQTAQQVAEQFQQKMQPLAIEMASDIPLAHGLGSSSSAVVAGIELANHYLKLNLSDETKVQIGTKIEGHPDNIGPCVTGGLFVGHYDHELTYYTSTLDNIALIVSIPPYEIKTEEARAALPDVYTRQAAVAQNARNNVMLLAMLHQDYQTMGSLMMQDVFHEPYRRHLIQEYDEIKDITQKNGAYATVISGAGPTLLTLCPEDKADQIFEALGEITTCKHERVNIFIKK